MNTDKFVREVRLIFAVGWHYASVPQVGTLAAAGGDLTGYGFTPGVDFAITRKKALENYIHPTALKRMVPDANVTYSDFDHAKNFCKRYPDSRVRGI